MALSSQISSVLVTPVIHRPSHDPSASNEESDIFLVMSLGEPFCYPIPSFDVLAEELRHMRIQGCKEGEFHSYYYVHLSIYILEKWFPLQGERGRSF